MALLASHMMVTGRVSHVSKGRGNLFTALFAAVTVVIIAALLTDALDAEPIVYRNTQYGFNFSLPPSWKGYTIAMEEWEGFKDGKAAAETGPLLLIRHPLWTLANPRQDIPIMVFTLLQWDLLQQGGFHVSAAPVGPSELGRNTEYVFALPPRYNYHFPTGWEEVSDILATNPLRPN